MNEYPRIEFDGIFYTLYPNKKYFLNTNLKKRLHREIWEKYNGKIPKGFHIHHKDGNTLNNDINNLECLLPKDHSKAHVELSKNDPNKDIHASSRKWHKSEQGKKWHKTHWLKRVKIKYECIGCENTCEKHNTGRNKLYICFACQCNLRETKRKANKKAAYQKPKKDRSCVYCRVCNIRIKQKENTRIKNLCSDNCKAISRRLSGVDNIDRNCVICDKKFLINKYSKTMTCGDRCRSQYISLRMPRG